MATQGPYSTGDKQHGSQLLWWLAPVGLILALLAVGAITVASLSGAGDGAAEAGSVDEAAKRKLAPYWTVKAGDTYSHIAEKTGLTIDELQTFNPTTDPTTIAPGQRLKLRLHVPKVPKRLGPRFWTVRMGQSYGSIAAKTGKPIDRLIQLNPKLKPSALQIGDRVRLRR